MMMKNNLEEKKDMLLEEITEKLECLINGFEKVLYDDDDIFLQNMKTDNLAGDDVQKYRFWEWTQGVGLFGLWKQFEENRDEKALAMLKRYYDERIADGLPSCNINTTAPMLTLTYLYEYTKNEIYWETCREWLKKVLTELPRTKEGGFQHLTSDTLNEQELWDDTLFMTILFIARMGKLMNDRACIEEAQYQFELHKKYLEDRKTGLWFHGWTFNGRHNFAGGLWGRGNSWVTIAIPELIAILGDDCGPVIRRLLTETLLNQVEALKTYQADNGMWHTLIDDSDSYLETSATTGFAYGILKAAHMGLIDESFAECGMKPLGAVMDYISEDGVVGQVSYGTPRGREEKQFYKDIEIRPMPYGQAMAILYLIEAGKELTREVK